MTRGVRKNLSRYQNPFSAKRVGRKRTLGQTEEDLVFISERYVKGYPVAKIAQELNEHRKEEYQLSLPQIQHDIDLIHHRWMASYLVNFDQAKARELAHVDRLEQEYWEAWNRSLQNQEETVTEKISDKQGSDKVKTPSYERMRVRKNEKRSFGSDRYLQGVEWCIEMRCKILGLLTTTQNINVNWRKQAEEAGYNPDEVVDGLYKEFARATSTPLDGESGIRSLGDGTARETAEGTE